jgi:hypothetical protein
MSPHFAVSRGEALKPSGHPVLKIERPDHQATAK